VSEWLPAARVTVRESTWASYRANLTLHVLPQLGHLQLRELSASQLNALYGELLENGRRDGSGGLSPRTVQLCHVTVHRVLKDAVRWGRLSRNVSDNADGPRVRRPEIRAWDASELRRFLGHVRDDRLSGLYTLAATAGMRRGELGLRWSDVDFDAGRVRVRQSLVVTNYRPHFSEPKTQRSRRSIALDGGTVAALKAHRARQLEERLAWGASWTDSGLCFTKEDGSHLHPEQVTNAFERHVRDAGLPRLSFHGLRHTFATIALGAGLHPKVVSDRLGHSNISITLDTYSHVIESVGEDAATKIGGLILGDSANG